MIGILEITLLDRIIKEMNGEKYVKFLNVQYRMNNNIMKFTSIQIYGNKQLSHHLNKDCTLNEMGVSEITI